MRNNGSGDTPGCAFPQYEELSLLKGSSTGNHVQQMNRRHDHQKLKQYDDINIAESIYAGKCCYKLLCIDSFISKGLKLVRYMQKYS